MSDSYLTPEQILALKQMGVGECVGVPIFGSGLHRDGEAPYSRDQMSQLVSNFNQFSTGPNPLNPVPIVIGHEDDQTWLDQSGLPAAGLVTQVVEQPGGVVAATLGDLPQTIAEMIDAGLYFTVSVEVDDQPPFGVPGEGLTLRRIALLGGASAQLKWLGKLPPVQYGRRPSRALRYAGRTPRGIRVFSEVIMDRKSLEAQLVSLGWSDATVALLSSLGDNEFAVFVNALLAEKAGAGGGLSETNATMPPRAQMIDDIIAADPSQDRATLEAMDDPTLFALWQSVTGAMDEFAETDDEGTKTVLAPPPVKPATIIAPALVPATELASLKTEYRELKRLFQRETTAAKARVYAERKRTEATHRDRVAADCKRLVESFAITPADADPEGPGSEFQSLLKLDHSTRRKYGALVATEYEARVAHLAKQAGLHKGRFSERVAVDANGKSKWDRIRESAAKVVTVGPSRKIIYERLHMLPPAGLR